MTLSKRERVLGVAAGVLLLIIGSTFLFWVAGGQFGRRLKERDRLAALVEKKRKAVDRLDQWERRSLPADLTSAKLEYEDWLRGLADGRFRDLNVDWSAMPPHKNIYRELPVELRGQGTLDHLTSFLYEFYSAGHLHKIGRLTIKSIKGSRELDLVLSIQALSLPGADRQDELSAEQSNRLALSKLEDYRKTIVRRRMEGERFEESGGLFASYVPPPPRQVVRTKRIDPPEPPPPEPPSFDPAEFTYVTGITRNAKGQLEAWVCVRTEKEGEFRLQEGESFPIGPFRGKIVRIGRDVVEIEVDGERRLVALDQSIREGLPLPD